jgi:hypothetical protein
MTTWRIVLFVSLAMPLFVQLAGPWARVTISMPILPPVTASGVTKIEADSSTPAQRARYAGGVLNGRNPAKITVLKPTKFEAVLNRRAAAELGLNVRPELLARVDEVIE